MEPTKKNDPDVVEEKTQSAEKAENFSLPYGDLLLDNPPMMALIVAAMDGEFKDVDPEAAFHDLTKAQQKYFSKLVIKIYTKAKEKKAEEEITAKMREVTVWTILPHNGDKSQKHEPSEAVAEMIVHVEDGDEE